MKIRHFIFSRFNVQYLEIVPNKLGLDPQIWMKNRINLFFDYCYPSVKSQSQKDFKWVVFFDSRTPKEFIEQISENDQEGIIEFKFTDHWDKLNEEILKILEVEVKVEDLIISTRLDCDDAVSSKFVQSIQSKASQIEFYQPFAINCSYGMIFEVNSGIYYRKMMRSNPFISLVQKKGLNETSIFGFEHQLISDQIKTIEIREYKMWLQVVHGGNILNKPSGLPCLKSQQSSFNIIGKPKNNPGFKSLIFAYRKYFLTRLNNLKVKISRLLR